MITINSQCSERYIQVANLLVTSSVAHIYDEVSYKLWARAIGTYAVDHLRIDQAS